MTTVVAELDKNLTTGVSAGYGAITIRVVVLQKVRGGTQRVDVQDEGPVDAAPDENLPDDDREKHSTATFMEDPRRGRQVCVFLINGQRQHAWDNYFIVRDLGFKYLRNRMLVIVDCDLLKPEAIADLMQGSRTHFYDGKVYSALESRVIGSLKGDPDLKRLHIEAEEDTASLEAGDEAVRSALDQLIEAHHDAAEHVRHGHIEAGQSSREDNPAGSLQQTSDVVIEADRATGSPASGPVLQLRPDVLTVRLRPNEARSFLVATKPSDAWKDVETLAITFDPPVKELQVTRSARTDGEEVSLIFAVPEDFDDDEYPIETVLTATATLQGASEPRVMERPIVVNQKRVVQPSPPGPVLALKDDPTFVKVTSRQPIKIVVGGPDMHVKCRWDGKDELVSGSAPPWSLRAVCDPASPAPQTLLTHPQAGRFELMIQATTGLAHGEQLKIVIEAVGPHKTLSTEFLVDVTDPPAPRKIAAKTSGGSQRRPPYALNYVKREDWATAPVPCFGNDWSGAEAGSFEPPDANAPLQIVINKDMDLLSVYRESLVAKRYAEATIQQRITKYTSHVAFHLYQIYETSKRSSAQPDAEPPSEDAMREEIQRVARTLIKIMEVTQ